MRPTAIWPLSWLTGLSIRMIGTAVALGLLAIAIGGATTSVFVLRALWGFQADWQAVTAGLDLPGLAALGDTAGLMAFLVFWGSVATISTLFAVGVFFFWFTNRKVVGPMVELTDRMDRLARGETEIDLHHSAQRDEVGAMARAVAVMRDNVMDKRRLEAEQADRAAAITAEKAATRHRLADSFEAEVLSAVDAIVEAAERLRGDAGQAAALAAEAAAGSASAANSADRTADRVHEIEVAATTLTETIDKLRARQSETGAALSDAGQSVRESERAAAQLSQASSTIGDVVALIDQIAEQTNLLALNATIEAARAGEAGKGFAIVAAEVKVLAGQTGEATQRIGKEIETIRARVADAQAAAAAIADVFARLTDAGDHAEGAVADQQAAVEALAKAVGAIGLEMAELTAAVAGAGDAAAKAGDTGEGARAAAGALEERGHGLKAGAQRFLAGVRAED